MRTTSRLLGPLFAMSLALAGYVLMDDSWHLGREIAAQMVIILLLALYNLTWCFEGLIQLVRGREMPVAIYRAVVVFGCTAMVLRHTRSLLGGISERGDPMTFEAFLFELAMMIAAAIGNHIAITRRANDINKLYECLDEALAMLTLWRVDPDEARALAKEARQRAARKAIKDA